MKLWLVPASDAPATANVAKTLSRPISEDRRVRAGLDGEYLRYAWGAKSGARNDPTLLTMQRGDLCLFYTSEGGQGQNQYNWTAKVLEVRRSSQISQALWEVPDFEWVYFLEKPSRIDLSVGELAAKFEKYRPNYFSRAPMGITSVDPSLVERAIRDHGSLENWLISNPDLPANVEDDFLSVLRRYQSEHVVFVSSFRSMRYAVSATDQTGCSIQRLDANETARCTTGLLREKIQLVRRKGGRHPFDDSFATTVAIRTCLVQAKGLGLTADRSEVVDVSGHNDASDLFCEIIRELRVDTSSGSPKLYKPAMVACLLEGIRKGELSENKILFDWIVPRFIEKMADLGEPVGEKEAAMPFFHLTGDLFWMLSYRDLGQLVSDGSEGPAAIRAKVDHATIKDSFWDALQNPGYLSHAEEALATKWWPPTRTPRFWVEKTIVNGRPDRQSGDHALGRALWSPQKAEDGKDIYRPMLEIRPGDVVFHFVDNKQVEGFSTAAQSADPSFFGIAGTDWADRPAYRIELKGHQSLVPRIDRTEFLGEGEYRPVIQELLNKEKGLFFNREFNLNQGAYITEAPLTLIRIWDAIHRRKTGSPIHRDWNLNSDPLVSGACWIFQGNPEVFDVDTYLRNKAEVRWSVRQHKDEIHKGDSVLIWKSGEDGGVVADCLITGDPSADIKEDAPELRLPLQSPTEGDLKCILQIRDAFVDQPISREVIKAALPDLTFIRFSQGTNFPISEADYQAILRLRNSKAKSSGNVRYWKIAPGRDAAYWTACRDGGFIAIGWDELGDLSEMTLEQFVKRRDELVQQYGWKNAGVGQAWRFRQIGVGDRIVANRGTEEVLGIGTVTGPYYFVEGEEYAHRLPVRWDDLRPRPIREGGWRKTLIEIGVVKFEEICGGPIIDPPHTINPEYPLAKCAEETGFAVETLERWKRGLERKGQAIFYGPPGTGKTFIAEKLAAHVVGGTDGINELVQFHPAYSYEDFMQGIRPQTSVDGHLGYPMAPGRFMEFCTRAASRNGPSVLIIDEINRANLSRVFGELMYLLEYRDRKIPLAGGDTFRIPKNVRLIGTMNTADRSIALVDHALRRRFTFLPLYPQYEILSGFQEARGFDAAPLVQQLKLLNKVVNDKHYEVGITFFLRDNLADSLRDIWQMEIEPYLEEYFFDQPEKFEQFRWDLIQGKILP